MLIQFSNLVYLRSVVLKTMKISSRHTRLETGGIVGSSPVSELEPVTLLATLIKYLNDLLPSGQHWTGT